MNKKQNKKKVVINICYGGYGLSKVAKDMYTDLKNQKGEKVDWYNRDDEDLISVVEKLGEEANDRHSKLKIVEIPFDCKYTILDYDGCETVVDSERMWN